MYLFDSDHLAILQRRTSPECQQILARMQGYADEDFFIPVVSFHVRRTRHRYDRLASRGSSSLQPAAA